jgi:hypothetical protein
MVLELKLNKSPVPRPASRRYVRLRLVDRRDFVYGLNLHDYPALDDQIDAEGTLDPQPFVVDCHQNLSCHLESAQDELMRQARFVRRFEQPGPERAMHLDRRPYDRLRQA